MGVWAAAEMTSGCMRGVWVGNGGKDPETCIDFCMLGIPSAGDGIILGLGRGVGQSVLLAMESREPATWHGSICISFNSTTVTKPPPVSMAQRSTEGARNP